MRMAQLPMSIVRDNWFSVFVQSRLKQREPESEGERAQAEFTAVRRSECGSIMIALATLHPVWRQSRSPMGPFFVPS